MNSVSALEAMDRHISPSPDQAPAMRWCRRIRRSSTAPRRSCAPFHVRRKVERAFNRRIVQIYRRRRHLITDRKDRKDCLDRTGSTQQMPGRRLGRRHRRPGGGLSHHAFHRAQLDRVGHEPAAALRASLPMSSAGLAHLASQEADWAAHWEGAGVTLRTRLKAHGLADPLTWAGLRGDPEIDCYGSCRAWGCLQRHRRSIPPSSTFAWACRRQPELQVSAELRERPLRTTFSWLLMSDWLPSGARPMKKRP